MEGVTKNREPLFYRRAGIATAYLLLITGAELLTVYATWYGIAFARYGIAFHGIILFALLIHSAVILSTDPEFSQLLMVLVIAPLIRILSFSMPISYFSYVTWFSVVSIPVYIAIFTCMYLQRLIPEDIALAPPKLRHIPLELGIILFAIPLGIAEYGLLKPGMLVEPRLEALLVPALILIVCTGFLEELAFRGLMQYHASRTMGLPGILFIAALCGILQTGNLTVHDVLLAGGMGFAHALVVQKTGSIYGVSISQGVINVVLFLIAPSISRSVA